MTHTTQTGTRCRTVHMLRTVKGDLPRGSQGTVITAILGERKSRGAKGK